MQKSLKGGMIGCGRFAQHHLEAWRRMPQVEIVAASDPQLERAEGFASRAYRSAEEMLGRESLDFVDIATRADDHFASVQRAVAKNIPVICQKPIARNWDEALALVECAESAGVPLMIHDNWRWQPWYRTIREMIVRGSIGAIVSYGFRSRAGDGRGDQPYSTQSYFRWLERLLVDQALVHHIDTARFLFGEIETVYAQAGRRNAAIVAEDWAVLTLTHAASIHGWIDGHRYSDPEPPGPVAGDFVVEGELGTLVVRPTGDVYRDQTLAWKNEITSGYRGDSVRATQAHFIACLQTQLPFETAGRDYLRTFAVVEAAYRSMETQRLIEPGRAPNHESQ